MGIVCVYSSVVEHFTDNEEAEGSIPSTRTRGAHSSVVERHIDIVKAPSPILGARTGKYE